MGDGGRDGSSVPQNKKNLQILSSLPLLKKS